MRVLLLLIFIVGFFVDANAAPSDICKGSECKTSQYMAGFARINISPMVGVDKVPTLAAGSQLVDKIHDPLYAKALVLSDGQTNIAFIALDLCFLIGDSFNDLQQHIIENSSYDHIVLAVTHTHSGMFNHSKLEQLKTNTLKALKKAGAELQPVKIGAASIVVDEAYNRRIHSESSVEMLWKNPKRLPNRPVDNTLGIIHLSTLENKTFASIVNYSAHPTVTMDLEKVVVSADYPGALASSISEELGGNVLFLPGAGGDVNPYDADTKPLSLALEKSKALGKKLALAAITAIKGIDNYTSRGVLAFSKISFPEFNAEISALILAPDIAMATFPGEYFDSFGKQLKARSPVEHTFFVGYSNGSIAYVPTEAATKLGGYGADLNSDVVLVTSDTGQQHTEAAIEQLEQLIRK